ncbi:MFS transporter [Westerdykella ornata]|uniref:MFS transporter n=1 Tax=Westerdykella ornata TaxID=318751 RepID=A0A6A6JCA2_WESOR|nr:MFS transporter [Westerdykella ornata]KAF2273803.1 MFS transporter [Westerdykella ornata]
MIRYQVLCILLACFGATFYGYDTSITASVLAYNSFIQYFELNNDTIGAMNSAYQAAAALGALSNFYLPNRLGRLRTIILGCTISVIGVTLQTSAQNYPMFVVGRTIGGIACGIVFSVCPVYANEISPAYFRGRVGALYALNITASFLITQCVGLGLYFIKGNTSWRLLFALQLIPALSLAIFSIRMPESPRFLALVGRDKEALEILRQLHGGGKETAEYNESDSYYQEFLEIRAQIEEDRSYTRSWRTIISKSSYLRRFALIIGFFFFQQFTGIIPLAAYQVIIYQMLGVRAVTSLILTVVYGIATTLGVITCGFWLDKVGRRPALLACYAGMIPSMGLIVGFWIGFEKSGNQNLGLVKGVLVGIYLVAFIFSGVMNAFGPTYASEIMPTEIRAAGLAAGYFVFNALAVLISQITPTAIASISWRYFLIFLIMDCIFIVIAYLFYPETRNLALEHIGKAFGDKVATAQQLSGESIVVSTSLQPSKLID